MSQLKLEASQFAELDILAGLFWGGSCEMDRSGFCRSFLATISLSIPAPLFSTEASANKLNGKPTCGQMNCMQDRYYAAKRKEAKPKKSN